MASTSGNRTRRGLPSLDLDRRSFLACFAGSALAGTALPEILWAKNEKVAITDEDLAAAERLAGLEMSAEERELMLDDVRERLASYEALRELRIGNDVPPAFVHRPLAPDQAPAPYAYRPSATGSPATRPDADDDLLALPVHKLAPLVRDRQLSSRELTQLYLDRLTEWGPELECVISLTTERALSEADRADREISRGRYRGPLHGIPWGAKDLLSAAGYPTTWGAEPYREQRIEEDATVVRRLTDAGAVLVAKLTLGALAWGDVWFGGTTRSPWNLEQGSSGSSAGSASATAGNLVGFSIGSETWGSIVSPCTRCGATGLRPTFGFVSRHGAMALSWSMDKLGPIGRSAEDCALVMEAIHGPDNKDLSVHQAPFQWNPNQGLAGLKIGVVESAFEEERQNSEWRGIDLRTLEELRSLGAELVPISLPDLPASAMAFILGAEAAAAFDELTLSGRDDELVRQIRNAWPNVFRHARFIPAVEYIQANRARTLLMRQMEESLKNVDLYLCPSFGQDNLLITNLTGHPAVVLPNGFLADGTPTSITFNGRLFGDATLLAAARAYQEGTDYHLRRPGPPYARLAPESSEG